MSPHSHSSHAISSHATSPHSISPQSMPAHTLSPHSVPSYTAAPHPIASHPSSPHISSPQTSSPPASLPADLDMQALVERMVAVHRKYDELKPEHFKDREAIEAKYKVKYCRGLPSVMILSVLLILV